MIVSVLLLTHVLGDFLFQSENMTKEKEFTTNNKKNWIIAHLLHALVHLIVLVVLLVITGISLKFDTAIVMCSYLVSHILIDIFKSLLKSAKVTHKKKLILFVFDQVAHLLIIFIIAQLISRQLVSIEFGNIIYVSDIDSFILNDLIKIGFLVLFIMLSGGIFVPLSINYMYKEFLENYDDSKNERNMGIQISKLSIESDIMEFKDQNIKERYKFLYLKVSVGKYIGIMERLLIVLGLLVGNYTLIIGVIGIKTWVRHNEFSRRSFSEYYLLGTMLSIVYSIIAFYSLNAAFELFELPFIF